MKDKQHISYSAFGNYFLDNLVGKKTTEEPVDAMLRLTHDEQVLSLLASIADVLQPIKPLLTVCSRALREYLSDTQYTWHDAIYREFKDTLSYREESHGECPLGVRHALYENYIASATTAARFSAYLRSGCVYGEIVPPAKGTELRKEYDRWMRRKPPVKK